MKQKNRVTKREWALILMCGVCIIIGLAMLTGLTAQGRNAADSEDVYDKELISYDDGWCLFAGDIYQDDVTLPLLVPIKDNTPVSVSKKLPESLMSGTYLALRSDNTFIDVYIDSRLIYSSGGFELPGGTVVAAEKWNFITLAPEYSGRTVTITFTGPCRYYAGTVPHVILGTLSEVMLYIASSAGVSVYLSVCIMAMGLLMLFLSVINTLTDASLRAYTYLSIYIAFLGLIMITRAQYPHSYANGYYSEYLIFHIALRLCPVVHCLYMYVRMKSPYQRFFGFVTVGCGCNFLISCTLYFSGLWDFTKSLWLAILLLVIPVLLSLYFDVLEQTMGSLRYRIVMGIGIGAYLLGIISEIFLRTSLYTGGQRTVLIACALVFSACQCIAVIISSYDLASEQIAIARELDDKRIKLMMSQMQPHFIYNALNTIRGMTLADPQKAYDMIYHFSHYLKHNIAALSDSDLIPFAQELEHIRAYTAIECERFKNKLNVIYDIRTVNFLIPPLTIEPFVENAIKHGVRKRASSGTVTITTEIKESHYLVSIADDGAGFDPSVLDNPEKHGIGIKNASYRLRELVGAHIDIKSATGCGCSVSIIIPKILSEGDLQ